MYILPDPPVVKEDSDAPLYRAEALLLKGYSAIYVVRIVNAEFHCNAYTSRGKVWVNGRAAFDRPVPTVPVVHKRRQDNGKEKTAH